MAKKDSEDKPIEEQNKVNRPSEDQDKLVIKRYELPGVDMTINDLEMLHTVKIKVTKVTKKMYKSSYLTFIGTKDQLDDNDVIKVGNMELLYRVINLHKMTDREGYIYRVKRVDGASTTALDMDNIEVGMKVLITNRKTFDQLMHHPEDLRDMKEECKTYCEEDATVCDTPNSPATIQGNPAQPPLTWNCLQYNITIPAVSIAGGGENFTYLNCSGDTIQIDMPITKTPTQHIICTPDITQNVYTGITPISEVQSGTC